MSAVVLDTTPLGILCHPGSPPHVLACRRWLADLRAAGRRVVLPEIADYELRREFLRRGSRRALTRLDDYGRQLEYLALNTAMMLRAAELWAQARNVGIQTAPDHALDGDMILCAQAESLGVPVVVATANVAHIGRFVHAELWQNISP